MSGYRHLYHIEGVTDEKHQIEVAERQRGPFIMHQHKKGEQCDDRCKAHWPEGKK